MCDDFHKIMYNVKNVKTIKGHIMLRNFLPFPPQIVKRVAEALEAGAKNGVIYGAAAYKEPDGQIHGVFDNYNPRYPEGSIPGVGDVIPGPGFERRALNFTPAHDLVSPEPWANPAIAVDNEMAGGRFIVAQNEDLLAAAVESFLPLSKRPTLRFLESDLHYPPECIFYMDLKKGASLVAGSVIDVSSYIMEAHNIDPKRIDAHPGSDAFLDVLRDTLRADYLDDIRHLHEEGQQNAFFTFCHSDVGNVLVLDEMPEHEEELIEETFQV